MQGKKDNLEVGKIVGIHGVHGEVKVQPWANQPETLLSYIRFYIDRKEMKIQSAFVNSKAQVIIKFAGINTVEDAAALKNKILVIPRNELKLRPGQILLEDMIGMQVVSTEGERIGTLEEILSKPASEILLIRAEDGKEILVPCVSEFVKAIDEKQSCITVEIIEGMR
jgi:16S rRNA processing protein RimM